MLARSLQIRFIIEWHHTFSAWSLLCPVNIEANRLDKLNAAQSLSLWSSSGVSSGRGDGSGSMWGAFKRKEGGHYGTGHQPTSLECGILPARTGSGPSIKRDIAGGGWALCPDQTCWSCHEALPGGRTSTGRIDHANACPVPCMPRGSRRAP